MKEKRLTTNPTELSCSRTSTTRVTIYLPLTFSLTIMIIDPNQAHQYYDDNGGEGPHLQHPEGDDGDENNNQYEEEEDGCATKKLVGSRIARKQAEDDVKLLANRIALLKMEEQKVGISKKIKICSSLLKTHCKFKYK